MNESLAREEICRVGKSLFDRGYVHATAGNISVRLDDGFLITPTDACMGFIDPARISKLDHNGEFVSGDRPSKTIVLHRSIYEESNHARCIIHTHSTHAVAVTLTNNTVDGAFGLRELAPAITAYFVMKVGRVPVIPYDRPGAPAVARGVVDVMRRAAVDQLPLRAVMLEALGPVVWADEPTKAMAILEELEETAKLWTLSSYAASPLQASQLNALRDAFAAYW
ncbi:MAG: aldolase [Burkholderiales bacterium]|nr:MAG: aldolase [Betaproteobacteria bacterium]TAG71770.1 MAG: aldolase [Burkholderiales bacterium]